MDKELTLEMINRYLMGEASSGEMAILNAWLDDLNYKPSFISSLSSAEVEQLSAKMFSKISKAIDACTENEVPQSANSNGLKNS